jgi:CcmD family protein
MMKQRICAAVFSLALATPAFAQQQPPPAAQGEYVPAAPGTATEQLPAAPLIIAAYAFVWVAAMGYVWSIGRRLTKVEDEMRVLERKAGKASR